MLRMVTNKRRPNSTLTCSVELFEANMLMSVLSDDGNEVAISCVVSSYMNVSLHSHATQPFHAWHLQTMVMKCCV